MLKYIKLNHRRGRLVASAANKLGTVSHIRHKPYTGVRRRKDHKRSPVDAARSLGRLDQKAADRSSRANIARSHDVQQSKYLKVPSVPPFLCYGVPGMLTVGQATVCDVTAAV